MFAQVLGECSLSKVAESSDKFEVVSLMAELQMEANKIAKLREKAAKFDPEERNDFMNEEGGKNIDIVHSLNEEVAKQLIDGSTNIPTGRLASLLWIIEN